MRILLTGGKGFIGSRLCEFLEKKTYYLIAPDRSTFDVRKWNDWEKIARRKIDHVVHLAGMTFVPRSWEFPSDFFDVNINGVRNAIEFCRRFRVPMTYISAYVYGIPDIIPISEYTKVNPNNPYSVSKYIGEELCWYYHYLFKLNVTSLRLFNVYGGGQNKDLLIGYILSQAQNNGNSICVRDLYPKRDYVHVLDVCRAIELSIRHTEGFNVFNVGSGQSYSVKEIIEAVQSMLGINKKVLSKNEIRKNEILDVQADYSAIKDAWGWSPHITLLDGLKECVSYQALKNKCWEE